MQVFNEPAAAGFGSYLSDDVYNYEELPFPADGVPDSADVGIRISGDSMEPVISDGAIVWVKFQPEVGDGDIGVFIGDGKAFCKKLKIDGSRRGAYLVSLNKNYKTLSISQFADFRTVGKVLL